MRGIVIIDPVFHDFQCPGSDIRILSRVHCYECQNQKGHWRSKNAGSIGGTE
jgi:hypothetical protein